MDTFKCDTIVINCSSEPTRVGSVSASSTTEGCIDIFSDSQFFPAPDGSWVVVDYMESGDWYVCY